MTKQKRRGALERLERRYALTQFGIPWPDPQQLTFSFVPDGTPLDEKQARVAGDRTSNLFASFNDASGASGWEAALMQALQTWAANANVNFVLVPDQGEPLGTPGLAQGDPRFGDIRFAAAPLSSDVVALGTPFSFGAGTLSGDIVFNSSYHFGEGPSAQYDLFSVALHEVGHVLGLPDSTDASSAMYPDYLGVRSGLAPADATAVDAVYGARPLDTSNQTLATATLLSPVGTSGTAVVDAELATPTDNHYYQYPVVDNEDVTIVLETAGLSLLEPQLTVRDSAGNVVASATSPGPDGGNLVVHVHNAVGNPMLVINVSSATASVFGVGPYRLVAVSGLSVPDDLLQQGPTASGDGDSGSDDGGDDSGGSANSGSPSSSGQGTGTTNTGSSSATSTGSTSTGSTSTGSTNTGSTNTGSTNTGSTNTGSTNTGSTNTGSTNTGMSTGNTSTGTNTGSANTGSSSGSKGTDDAKNGDGGVGSGDQAGSHGRSARHNYSFHSTLLAPTGVQYEHVTVPAASGPGTMTLTATVSAQQSGAAAPLVTVLDSSGSVVAAEVLENANGTYSVQVVGVTPGAVYSVAVAAANPAGSAAVGRYRLSVDFDSTPVALTTYSSGTLTAAASYVLNMLQVNTPQFFHFLFSATDSATSGPPVTMTIYDTSGNVVQSVAGQAGSALTTTVLLEPGTYVLRLAAAAPANSQLPDTTYQLQGVDLSDPLGPAQIPPIMTPPPPAPTYVYTPAIPYQLYLLSLGGLFGPP